MILIAQDRVTCGRSRLSLCHDRGSHAGDVDLGAPRREHTGMTCWETCWCW